MESLVVLGLVSNIVQFVHFGANLLSETSKIHHSAAGALIGNADLELIAKNAKHLSAGLEASCAGLGSHSQLQKISKECRNVSEEIIAVLDDLRVKAPHGRWESFKQAAKSIRHERKIEDLKKKLDKLQNGLVLCLMVMMKDQYSDIHTTLEKLLQQHKKMEISGAARLQNLKTDFIEMLESSQRNSLERSQRNAQEGPPQITKYIKEALDQLIDGNKRAAATQYILKSLKYDQMTARQSTIEDAHKHTFDWIFEDTSKGRLEELSFLKWLSKKDGIYWIAGRAGSGKSTLMKYLFKHPSTAANLRKWAKPKALVMASHFFWVAGSRMQKSQEGLLSSLLHNIFTRCPELIPAVTPSRWELAFAGTQDPEPWTRAKLLQAFEHLRAQNEIPVKFCFFVDGLDEYDGDHAEIVRILQNFVTSPDIKVCVSSRPWNIFEKMLGANSDAKLYLEDLTRDDIRLYVHDNLKQDDRFEALEEEDGGTSKMYLVREIVDLAHGVFLWVVLVVRDLLRGLSNDDTIGLLKERLYSLPPTLEQYFKSMLDRIDMVYREQTAQIMFMALAANKPLSLMTLSFLDQHGSRYAIERPIDKTTNKNLELEKICIKTRTRVKARCSDLLEVTTINPGYFTEPRVVFLHRTVRDFLLTRDIQDYLYRQLRTPFDPNVYFCAALLAQMKMLPRDHLHISPEGVIVQMMIDFLCYAHSIEQSGNLVDSTLLDEAERVLQHQWSLAPSSTFQQMSDRLAIGSPDVCIFQGAIQFGLCRYVEERLRKKPELAKGRGHFVPLEAALFFPMREQAHEHCRVHLDMLKLLLNHESSPNQYILGRRGTVWTSFLESLPNRMEKSEKEHWVEYAQVLLAAGANSKIGMSTSPGPFEFLAHVFSQHDLQRLRSTAFATENGRYSVKTATWGWTDWRCCAGQRKRQQEQSETSPLLRSFADF